MAAKPKLTPEQWASTRATWEDDPRKPLAWLVEELGLPVSAEALRLRAKAEGWVKGGAGQSDPKLVKTTKLAKASPKLAKTPKTKLGNGDASFEDVAPTEVVKLRQMNDFGLTPNQDRFVQEYLIDLNGTKAYMRAYPDASEATASSGSTALIAKHQISAAISVALKARSERTQISADQVLREAWSIATADARELVQVKVGCCRHCYGEGHKRQRTVGEMNCDREAHVAKQKDIAEFDEEGGIGFDPLQPPKNDCPECGGDGQARMVLMDTRTLSPSAAALYAGAKQTKFGIEIQVHSKSEALEKLFRHLGLYELDNLQKDDGPKITRDELAAMYVMARATAEKSREEMIARRKQFEVDDAKEAGGH